MASDVWTAVDIPDQTGRRIVITGGNSGIGKWAATQLARAGAQVMIAVRDLTRGRQAASEIGASAEVCELDLADLSSVRAFAEQDTRPIDVLINNAGLMAPPLGRTKDGFELQFGVNHLGHFALTNLLLPRITDRVVTVSSGAHRRGRIELADLNWTSRRYQPWLAYGQSKLANLLFTLELERRLTESGSPVRALAAHPGWAATNLQGRTGNRLGDWVVLQANRFFAQSAEMGALPLAYAATMDIPGGSYVGPGGRREMSGYPTLVGRTAAASDTGMARRLWAASEELTGIGYPL
jgi:NAD(P)-dependent dehydrogenase (short-subunit alcohol dehydrogenase family)